jgi:hypothetical protein
VSKDEFTAFDMAMRKIISVSREEVEQRAKKWKREKSSKKKAKISPASPSLGGKG